jgi:hypothetical protein
LGYHGAALLGKLQFFSGRISLFLSKNQFSNNETCAEMGFGLKQKGQCN